MSRNQLQRTPDNFPRMKHRAAGRLSTIPTAPMRPVLLTPGMALRQIGDAFRAFWESFTKAADQTQDDYALAGPTKEGGA